MANLRTLGSCKSVGIIVGFCVGTLFTLLATTHWNVQEKKITIVESKVSTNASWRATKVATSTSKPKVNIMGPVSWASLPKDIQQEFGTTPALKCNVTILHWYLNDAHAGHKGEVWDEAALNRRIEEIKKGKVHETRRFIYPLAGEQFHHTFAKHPVTGKSIFIGGSIQPWVEAIVLGHGAKSVLTADYNLPIYKGNKVKVMLVPDLMAMKPRPTFDVVVSYSSIEHDGLGRYGDPISPGGSIRAVEEFHSLLNAKGILYLGIPTANVDTVVFNANRMFGRCMFKELIRNKFKLLNIFIGDDPKPASFDAAFSFSNKNLGRSAPNVLFVLEKI